MRRRLQTLVATGWRDIFVRSTQRDSALDGLRAIACIWVVGVHTISFLGSFWLEESRDVHVLDRQAFIHVMDNPWLRILQKGYMGVDLFFVLTGLLMGRILLRELDRTRTINVPKFYYGRILRLFPAYAAVLIVNALLVPDNDIHGIWANIFYVNNYLPTYKQFMIHGWSLAVEQQYYVLLPLVLLAISQMGQLRKVHVVVAILLGVALRALAVMKYQLYVSSAPNPAIDRLTCELYNDAFDNKLHTQFGSMATGLLVAFAMTRSDAGNWLRAHRWASVLGLVISAGIVYAIVSPSPVGDPQALSSVVIGVYMTLFQPLFAAAMAFIVYLAVLRCGPTRNFFRFLEHRAWFPIAQLSYGVYLVHLLIIKLVYSTMPPTNPSAPMVALMWLGFVVAALALAVPLFIFVEAPFMRLRAKRKQHGVTTAPRAPQPRSPAAPGGDIAESI
jgi:peptidoglycan/LPS O-acetylase OafA/YrhL